MLGLFDRPVEEKALAALLKPPVLRKKIGSHDFGQSLKGFVA
jgi:hypothetical protein